MKTALIGYTGFVGSNLRNQYDFDDMYNSANISEIKDKEYDLVVCAGAPGVKWMANKEPEKDLASINNLQDNLASAKIDKLVLISTVDVYKQPIHGVDEDTGIAEDNHAYGHNRYLLEQFITERFDTLVVRLPALYGKGLKKNIIYDLMHDNNVDQIHSGGEFQFYFLDNLWTDIQKALDHELMLVNISVEPVLVSTVAKDVFGIDFNNQPEGQTAAKYDMHSKHADLWGGHNGYMYDVSQSIADMKTFVAQESQS